jgi:hypothetical protein
MDGPLKPQKQLTEELARLRMLFALGGAIDVSVLGWLAQNYTAASNALIGFAYVVIIIVTISIVGIGRIALRHLHKLEDE